MGAFQGDLLFQIRNWSEGSTLQFECSIEGSHEDYNGRPGLIGSLSDLEARMSIEPIAHMPVYKRIELRPVRVREPPEPVNARAERIRSAEADRIWAITRQTAEGCNQPTRRR